MRCSKCGQKIDNTDTHRYGMVHLRSMKRPESPVCVASYPEHILRHMKFTDKLADASCLSCIHFVKRYPPMRHYE